MQDDAFPLLIGQLNANHGTAGDGRHAGRQGRHIARNIIGQLDHTAGLDAGCGFQFIHGDNGAGPDFNNLALDVKVIEHRFEQSGVALQCGLVELIPR